MKIETKLTCPSNEQLQYIVGCVSWSSFGQKQAEAMIRFLFKLSDFSKIKSIDETFQPRMIQFNFLFVVISNLEIKWQNRQNLLCIFQFVWNSWNLVWRILFALQQDQQDVRIYAGNLIYGLKLHVSVGDWPAKQIFQCVAALFRKKSLRKWVSCWMDTLKKVALILIFL